MLPLLLLLLLDDPPPRIAETIVVTAERLEQPVRDSTAAITVVTREELERLPARDLGDALRIIPGLQLISVNPGAPPMISSRGFFGAGEVEYLQLLVDGMPVGDAETGLADWRAIPLESIERIEVLRGPGSSLFGDTALGGVVQVFRRRGTQASASVASFGTVRANGAYAAESFAVSATAARSDGFRDHSASRETFANVAFHRARWRASLDLSHRDREDAGSLSREQLALDPFGSDELFANDGEESRRLHAAVRYRSDAFELLGHVHDRASEQTRTLLLAPGFGDTATRDVDTRSFGGTATRTFALRGGRVIAGVDAASESLHSRYSATVDGRGSRRRAALFASGEWNVTEQLRVAAGARFDRIDDEFEDDEANDSAFSPRVALSLDLGNVTPYVQLSRAFKAPTLDQRFDQRPLPDFTGGTFTISNPNLVPQEATNVEAGARGAAGRFDWEAIGYWITVENEIDFDFSTFRYANIGRSRHVGLETAIVAPFPRASWSASYTWTRVEALEGEHRGKQLKNIAEHVVRAAIDGRSFIDVHLGIEHSTGRFLDDANRFALDDATLVDLSFSRNFGAITAALEATNLFDARFSPLGLTLADLPYEHPAAGRSIGLTVRWKGAPPP